VFSPIVSLSGECDALSLDCERQLQSEQHRQAATIACRLASFT
jgi:hypothetical protein